MKFAFIPGFDGYRVGDDGSIWSRHRNRWGFTDCWRKLKPGTNNPYGRQIVCIKRNDGKLCSCHVHRLVLLAFIGPCPDGMEACHNDNDPSNNTLGNLRWDTRESNTLDMRQNGKKKGERHHAAILTDDLVRTIRARAATGESHGGIAKSLGMQRRNISRIVDRSRWSHVN